MSPSCPVTSTIAVLSTALEQPNAALTTATTVQALAPTTRPKEAMARSGASEVSQETTCMGTGQCQGQGVTRSQASETLRLFL
jgi:cytochrome c-type biogenesis protein CcmH/NrfF